MWFSLIACINARMLLRIRARNLQCTNKVTVVSEQAISESHTIGAMVGHGSRPVIVTAVESSDVSPSVDNPRELVL